METGSIHSHSIKASAYVPLRPCLLNSELLSLQFRKPCDIAFRIMQRRWKLPFENIIYVGDNLHKDFQAPKQLGMQWKHIQNKDGLYQ